MARTECEECFPKKVDVVEILGSGHYGDTYHVRDKDGKDFAIKMFIAEKLLKGERNLEEVFQTGHENCITFLISYWRQHKNESYGHVIISMELCEKKTLKNWMIDNMTPEQRPIEMMKRWMAQLLSGLSSLHDWGLVHRDLKPDNIFFARDKYGIEGILKIGDFGMIKRCLFVEDTRIGSVANEKGKAKVTQPVKRYGNIRYAAPEILKDIRKQKALKNEDNSYDYRVDIFSLGVVFAELINPKKQDKDDSKKEEPRKSSELLKGFGGDVKAFLKKAICESVENRLSAAELLMHKFLENVEKPLCPPAPAFIDKDAAIPNKTVYNGTIARMGLLLQTFVPEKSFNYYINTFNKEKKIHAILGAQRLLTGSSEVKAELEREIITLNILSAYFQQLMALGHHLQNRLLWLGLERHSLEKLKKSYTRGHIKLIPSFKVWCSKGGQEFLIDMWKKVSQRPMFPHGSPLTFVPQEDELKYNATADFLESKEKLQKEWKNLFENESQLWRSETFKQVVINTPLCEDAEHLRELVMLLLSFLDAKSSCHTNPIDDGENPREEDIRAYIRLLFGACVFRLSINEEKVDGFHFTLPDDFKEVAGMPDCYYFTFPSFRLFITEPMEHWESWAEIGWPAWFKEQKFSSENEDTSEQRDTSEDEEPDNDSNSLCNLRDLTVTFGDLFGNVRGALKFP